MWLVGIFVTGVVLWGIANTLGLFALSRLQPQRPPRTSRPRFVAVIPALNEGTVIGATVRHLLGLRFHAVVVVDDGSDDDTAARVQQIADPRVVLVRRQAPRAREGKGAALNAALRHIRRSPAISAGARPERVVLCVLDADGRLDRRALREAARAFADPRVGACQVAVRVRNRGTNLWTWMQHVEFVVVGALYQRGRERTGAVGLGGNGQFVRLAALDDLGEEPWSSCLTEDTDLGIRLLVAGWQNRYLPHTWVSQQGLPDLPRLLRQRTRWFQGALQCLRHLPAVAGSPNLPLRTRMDLTGILLSPLLLLAVSPALLGGWAWLAVSLPATLSGAGGGIWLGLAYALAFSPALLVAFVYWREGESSLPRALLAAHLFVAYGMLWPIAGWRAAVRALRGQSGWTKTPRVAEPEVAEGRRARRSGGGPGRGAARVAEPEAAEGAA